jgi:tetratricopeptide (TPR) repeat protein
VWQQLYKDLAAKNFTVIAVALDEAEAARPWIDAATPDYPCVIDRNHHVADLYSIVNVPQAVWIDERGHIVRPAENAGQSDAFRRMDRATGQMTAEQVADRAHKKKTYVEAIRDWVLNGTASEHAFTDKAAQAHLRLPDENAALGHAHFRLAQHLKLKGRDDEARRHFDEASRLHPNSWNIFRQSAAKSANGLAGEKDFWARVEALGDRPYHLPIDLKGID